MRSYRLNSRWRWLSKGSLDDPVHLDPEEEQAVKAFLFGLRGLLTIVACVVVVSFAIVGALDTLGWLR